MDYLRACYRAEVHYLEHSDAVGYITWQPAAPGARAYPYPHAFSSSMWEPLEQHPYGPIGEFHKFGKRVKPVVSPFDGKHNTLDPYIALHGIPQSALSLPPSPTLCNFALRTSTGGIRCGGLATVRGIGLETSTGGIRCDGGAVVIPVHSSKYSVGGVRLNGTAGLFPEAPVVSTGGIVTGGIGVEIPAEISEGGIVTGGTALITVFSTGGVLLDGLGLETHVQIVQPFGPELLGAGGIAFRSNVVMVGCGFIR